MGGGADTIAEWERMMGLLMWRPIRAYDQLTGKVVMVRFGDEYDVAFYGVGTGFGPLTKPPKPEDKLECWRSAQKSDDERPLDYEPAEFAPLSPAWREATVAD